MLYNHPEMISSQGNGGKGRRRENIRLEERKREKEIEENSSNYPIFGIFTSDFI